MIPEDDDDDEASDPAPRPRHPLVRILFLVLAVLPALLGCWLTSMGVYVVALSVTGVAVGGAIVWGLVLLPAVGGIIVSAILIRAWYRVT